MNPVSPDRTENVKYANAILDAEIRWRNERKESQENAARGVIVAAGVVLSLLLGLSGNAGLFTDDASAIARYALAAIIVVGAGAAACSICVLLPRKYDRLGSEALGNFNQTAYLDLPSHEVMGSVAATRIGIAEKMDTQHEKKAKWLTRSLCLLLVAFVLVAVEAATLAIDPPPKSTAASTSSIIEEGVKK